jgi:hypothetical protein
MEASHDLREPLRADKLATDIAEVAAMEPMRRARFEGRVLYQVYYSVAQHFQEGGNGDRAAEMARMGEGVLRLAQTLSAGMSIEQAKDEYDADPSLVERRARKLYPSVLDELSDEDSWAFSPVALATAPTSTRKPGPRSRMLLR